MVIVPTLFSKPEAISGTEYAIDGGSWVTTVEFTGLDQATSYSFTQRLVGTTTHNVSATSNALVESTSGAALASSVAITDDGTPQYGETLNADVSGITNNSGTLAYQWARTGSYIVGANGSDYTLVRADIGETITVEVSSNVQSGSLTSSATSSIEKANQAKPDAPTVASKTYNSVTLEAVSGTEYAIDGGSWVTTVEFTGLDQATSYSFTQRLVGTTTHNVSATSNALVESTSGAALASSVAITDDGTPQYGETLNADITLITNNTGTLSYQWKRANVNIVGATGSTYGLTAADINATLKVVVSSNVQTGDLSSSATAAITKADQSAPSAPTLDSKTSNTIVLNVSTDCEYSIDASTWQASPEFTALTENTAYNLYQRYSETSTNLASASSALLSVTTNAAVIGEIAGTVTLSGTLINGQTLTLDDSGVTGNTGTLEYQWYYLFYYLM